jgi:lipopolysaccharide/colanic/teichoic acid biosynthesis glycosyltransferase
MFLENMGCVMYQRYVKRLLDIILSIILLPFILPIVLICGLFIFLEDRGPIFYCGLRLGKNKENFKMFKLRTMKVNAPDIRNADGSTFNSSTDTRLTKVGRFLRKTSLDELPQIFNVLIGNMSFIGPRPDLPEHINYYEQDETRKLDVLPGITGYNQAYFRNSLEWKQRLKNDVYYVDNISFSLDVKILFATISGVIKRRGIYSSEEKIKKTGRNFEG